MSIEAKVNRFFRRAAFLVLIFLVVVGSYETFQAYQQARPHLVTMYEGLSLVQKQSVIQQWVIADVITTVILFLVFVALLMFSNRKLTFKVILKWMPVAILLAPVLLIEFPLSVVENQYFGLNDWMGSLLFLLLVGLFVKDLGPTLYTEIRKAKQRHSMTKGD